VRTARTELLDRTPIWNERQLRRLLVARLERLALSKTSAPPRKINRAFNKSSHPEILDEATNHRSRRN